MENEYLNQNNLNISNNIELRNKSHSFFEYFKTHIKNVPQKAKDRLKYKRKITYKEAKINDFGTYGSTKYPGEYYGNTLYKIVKSKSKNKLSLESDKVNKMLQNTYLDTTTIMIPDFRITDYSKNFLNLKSVTSSYDDGELDTAEIEAILNGFKHREIEMIAEHDPSITSLITSTVNDQTYRPTLYLHKNIFPSDISPEHLNKENHKKTTKKHPKIKHQLVDHILVRREASTPSKNTECKIQNQIKNVFEAVKKKIVHDYNKEVTYTKTSLKHAFKDITNKICNITKTCQKEPTPSTKSTSKNTPNKTTTKLRSSRSTESHTNLSDKKSTHTIPVLGDDFSMLTMFEKLLSKSQEQNVINILTTNVPANRRSFRHKKNSTDINQILIDEFEYPNSNLDQYYVENNYDKSLLRKFDNNMESDLTTEDMSFEALSNKLSYNDYVNGYKYYLNFQKQQDDNKFSNLIRYQAHKHHKVDDIGKYILNKLPRLPTTRIKRYFVESETLEDQDVSTKSEDSWFKKHFFLFLDTNPSKKFHSTQTITCKDNDFIKNNKQLRYCTLAASENTTLEGDNHNSSGEKSKSLKIGQMIPQTYIKYKRNINVKLNKNDDITRLQKKTTWSTNNNDKPLQKYTNIPLSTRSTTVVKLQKKTKKKPIRVFHLFHRKGKQNHKREDRVRVQRFNFLKGVKDIFKDSPKYSHLRQEKLFDYEIMSSSKPHHHHNMRNNYKIEELIRQIPNISSNFESVYPFFDLNYNKLNEDLSKYTKYDAYSTSPSKLLFNKENDFWLSYGIDNPNQFKSTTTPYENSNKPSLPVQVDNTDLASIYANLKTDYGQGDINFPVTLPSLNTIVKYDEINNKYRIKMATIHSTKQKNENRETEKMYTLKSTKINSIDKGMTKFLMNLKDSTLENSFNMYKSNDSEYSRDKIFAENKNKNNIEKYQKLPEQYFSTPLPMNIKEFNTFLSDHHLDVESVTATLRNSVSFNGYKTDKLKVSKKYVPKSTSITNDMNFFRAKQFNVKVAKENKQKENIIGFDFKDMKQGPYDNLKYADPKDSLNKDAFRFTSMKTYGSYIDNTSTLKTTKTSRTSKDIKYPKKIQVSGHNYKYDIIFHNMKKKKRNDDNMCEDKPGDKIGILR